jgi:hypothetical protein
MRRSSSVVVSPAVIFSSPSAQRHHPVEHGQVGATLTVLVVVGDQQHRQMSIGFAVQPQRIDHTQRIDGSALRFGLMSLPH